MAKVDCRIAPAGGLAVPFTAAIYFKGDVNLKPTKRTCSAAVALALISLAGVSAAEDGKYYRWMDASGTPVNSDRPPPVGIPYETIATKTNARLEESTGEAAAPVGEKPAQETVSGQEVAGVPRMEVLKSPEACAAAKQNLETLSTHARIRIPDGEGSYRFLNEDEKAVEREKAEAAIARNCE